MRLLTRLSASLPFGRRTSAALRAAPTAVWADPFRGPVAPTVLDLNAAAPSASPPMRVTADRFPPPPAGLPALRSAVAERYGRSADTETLVTHGATGGFRAALHAFVGRGRTVVLLDPCSSAFAPAVAANGGRVRWVPTRSDGDRLRLDFDALSRAMRGASLVAVADPGNPLGRRLTDDDADRLRWTADRSDVLLFVDETYGRAGGPLTELAPVRTLVAGSLAGIGYGGLRVGWLTGPAELVRDCELAQRLTAGPVPAVTQQAAWRLLADPQPAADHTAGRELIAARLSVCGLTPHAATDGPFVWAEVGDQWPTGRAFAEALLEAEGVRVGPGDLYGPSGTRFIRLTAAADQDRLREGLNRLARFAGGPTRPARPPAVQFRRPAFSR